ncbi:MAG: hypothetical protein NTY68_00910 [Candidatus Micrarchaeota archaeon]|nr:hypothetical protein [Candidatus Micrarchaeota archaeon]
MLRKLASRLVPSPAKKSDTGRFKDAADSIEQAAAKKRLNSALREVASKAHEVEALHAKMAKSLRRQRKERELLEYARKRYIHARDGMGEAKREDRNRERLMENSINTEFKLRRILDGYNGCVKNARDGRKALVSMIAELKKAINGLETAEEACKKAGLGKEETIIRSCKVSSSRDSWLPTAIRYRLKK